MPNSRQSWDVLRQSQIGEILRKGVETGRMLLLQRPQFRLNGLKVLRRRVTSRGPDDGRLGCRHGHGAHRRQQQHWRDQSRWRLQSVGAIERRERSRRPGGDWTKRFVLEWLRAKVRSTQQSLSSPEGAEEVEVFAATVARSR